MTRLTRQLIIGLMLLVLSVPVAQAQPEIYDESPSWVTFRLKDSKAALSYLNGNIKDQFSSLGTNDRVEAYKLAVENFVALGKPVPNMNTGGPGRDLTDEDLLLNLYRYGNSIRNHCRELSLLDALTNADVCKRDDAFYERLSKNDFETWDHSLLDLIYRPQASFSKAYFCKKGSYYMAQRKAMKALLDKELEVQTNITVPFDMEDEMGVIIHCPESILSYKSWPIKLMNFQLKLPYEQQYRFDFSEHYGKTEQAERATRYLFWQMMWDLHEIGVDIHRIRGNYASDTPGAKGRIMSVWATLDETRLPCKEKKLYLYISAGLYDIDFYISDSEWRF